MKRFQQLSASLFVVHSALLACTVSAQEATKIKIASPAKCEACEAHQKLQAMGDASNVLNLSDLPVNLFEASVNSPVKFAIDTPSVNSQDRLFTITLCGHVCDGERCYVEDDTTATVATANVTDSADALIQADSSAPPMPMLQSKRSPSKTVTISDNTSAEVTLREPIESNVANSNGSQDAELRAKVEYLERMLEQEKNHSLEIRELLEVNSELRAEASQLSVANELMDSMMELIVEKTELQAELRAAKEWIGQKVAESSSSPVATAAALEELRMSVAAIQADLSVLTTKQMTSGSDTKPPVPFARSTYVPLFSLDSTSQAESCGHCLNSSASLVADVPCTTQNSGAACPECEAEEITKSPEVADASPVNPGETVRN